MLDVAQVSVPSTEGNPPLLIRQPIIGGNAEEPLDRLSKGRSRPLSSLKPLARNSAADMELSRHAVDAPPGAYDGLKCPLPIGPSFHGRHTAFNCIRSQPDTQGASRAMADALPPGYVRAMDKWQRIAQAREQLGISQRELSKRAGLSPAVVNKIEAGERPNASHETLEGIARALGVSRRVRGGREALS